MIQVCQCIRFYWLSILNTQLHNRQYHYIFAIHTSYAVYVLYVWIHVCCVSYVCGSGDASSRPCLLLRLSVGASREDRCHRPISGLCGRDRPGIRSLGRQRAPADGCRQRDTLCGPGAGTTHKYTQLIEMSCPQFGVIGNKCASNLLTNGSNMRRTRRREEMEETISFKLTQLHGEAVHSASYRIGLFILMTHTVQAHTHSHTQYTNICCTIDCQHIYLLSSK